MRPSDTPNTPAALRTQIRQHQRFLANVHRLSPKHFRKWIRLDDDAKAVAERLCDWQKADFEAIDPAWERLVGLPARSDLPVSRAWIERSRGHSKTSDTALMVAWALAAADRPITGLAAAADRDQARLLRRAVGRLVDANSQRLSVLHVTEDRVVNTHTQSELRVISSDAASSYGELVDFILCDELCHWQNVDLWHSLLSTAAKRAHCLLLVLTNAGVGTGWQWQARETARQESAWYFSSLDGPQAPWITPAVLEEQKTLLPEPVFNRLWLNQWQHSDGEFLTLAEVEACRDESLAEQTTGRAGVSYVAAIDYGEKRDYTAALIAHRDGRRVIVDRLDVAVPTPSQPIPTRWVEQWIEKQTAAFPGLHVWVDEHQLVSVVQKYEHRFPVQRFAFAGGKGNHQLAVTLRQLILNGDVAWAPDCGAIVTPDGGRDDLETELASLILRQSAGGRVRFDHVTGRHDDRAFVLAVACQKLLEQPRDEWYEIEDSWA